MVDYNGLENRRTERYRGFESLSLRKQGCKSVGYVIYTLYYTQVFIALENLLYSFIVISVCIRESNNYHTYNYDLRIY